MRIDELKEELRKIRAPEVDGATLGEGPGRARAFLGLLKRQDREDERYVLRNRIIPIAVGIVLFGVLMAVNPIHNSVMLGGCLLIFFSLICALVLYLIDYMNISKESFDTSVYEFLVQKEKRLRYWRTTTYKYKVIIGLYLVGSVMITLGNTSVLRDFTTTQIAVYLLTIIGILIVFWVIGEWSFRRRHRDKHEPLLAMIAEIKGDMQRES